MRPTHAEINLKNLLFNYINIKKKVKKSKIMTVVKADAYGHGVIECVKALEALKDKKPDYYGVALVEEAVELRKSKNTKRPILCFAPFDKEEFSDYLKYNIIPTITDLRQLKFISKLKMTKQFKVQVNVDTGMGRVGIHYTEARDLIKHLSRFKNIKIDGIYTHFATSDEKEKTFAKLQLKRFIDLLNYLSSVNIDYGLAHSANSGAILDMPESYLDMVRCGISLYGYYPSQETSESIKLKPVMSLVSKVSSITNDYGL